MTNGDIFKPYPRVAEGPKPCQWLSVGAWKGTVLRLGIYVEIALANSPAFWGSQSKDSSRYDVTELSGTQSLIWQFLEILRLVTQPFFFL